MATPTNQKQSNIEKVSTPFRQEEIVRNIYSDVNEYNTSNPRALSAIGKGENNGQVGSADDIKARTGLLAKNKYNPNHEYDAYN